MCCVEDAGGGAPSPTKRCLSRSKDNVCVERDVSFANDIVMNVKCFETAVYSARCALSEQWKVTY